MYPKPLTHLRLRPSLPQQPDVGRALATAILLAILGTSCRVDRSEAARYENEDHGYHFEYPLEWNVVVEEANLDTEGDVWVSVVRLGDAGTVTRPILDLIVSLGSGMDVSLSDLSAYAEQRVEERVVGSFMVMSNQETTVAERPAREMAIVYEFAVGPHEEVPPLTFTERVVFWEKAGNFYELSCRAVTEDVPACDEAFDLAKRTFAFQ